MSRLFPSGRFAYSVGHKSHEAAYEAMCDMVNGCELSPHEGQIEPYNASATPRKRITRYHHSSIGVTG